MTVAHAIDVSASACQQAVATACARIAPAWPLDQAVAVNPWWHWRDTPMAEVAARLEALGNVHPLMPKDYYLAQWQQTILPEDLDAACAEASEAIELADLLRYLREPDAAPHWHNFSELLDQQPERAQKMAWREEIVQQISQFCGLYCQHPQLFRQPSGAPQPLYQAWLEVVRRDRGLEILLGEPGLARQFDSLPAEPEVLILDLYQRCGSPEGFADYAYALLLEIHGWAGRFAYEAHCQGPERRQLEQLLAIRMAWEWVLWRHAARTQPTFAKLERQFLGQFRQLNALFESHRRRQRLRWVWQRALEHAYQRRLREQLSEPLPAVHPAPTLQAVFCIDVRSEPMRRALEAQHPTIQTLGCAGFFGLPLELVTGATGETQPLVPGLLKPHIQVSQLHCGHRHSAGKAAMQFAGDAPPAAFGLVETLGLSKAWQLLRHSWLPSAPRRAGIDGGPWQLSRAGRSLDLKSRTALAAGALRGMGLTAQFANTVLLVGHASSSANNAQAAALDCGACGGHSGEISAQVLAQLLNDADVRQGLAAQAIHIPEATRFVAALHDTTTDTLTSFGCHGDELWQAWLTDAGQLARKWRAPRLAMAPAPAARLLRRLQRRARDWAQPRPEWGLANNAALIVAPRARTRHLDLEGRCFLHDYDWRQDHDFNQLAQIIGGPLLVSHWINLQYYAAVTDHNKYGSGDKLLHNVVAGGIGLFEGHGGDLRSGPARQALHDGKQWRHQPLRLTAYLAAPREAIASAVRANPDVANLMTNQWLHLRQLGDRPGEIWRLDGQSWGPALLYGGERGG